MPATFMVTPPNKLRSPTSSVPPYMSVVDIGDAEASMIEVVVPVTHEGRTRPRRGHCDRDAVGSRRRRP